ncbi:hypothetical protein GCM10009828_035720 [Actinoplanes couchii]|uniref:Uncharacterized protein n=1 Tax=Actinoplanes couchii TaxID=403638 RepID=A0ABQ3X9C1_9ACTN|nr:hypothetical protein Aco03nite_034390 [Actinoplanes couchii]
MPSTIPMQIKPICRYAGKAHVLTAKEAGGTGRAPGRRPGKRGERGEVGKGAGEGGPRRGGGREEGAGLAEEVWRGRGSVRSRAGSGCESSRVGHAGGGWALGSGHDL